MNTKHYTYNVTVHDTDEDETWTLKVAAEDEFHAREIVDARYDRQDLPIEITKITKARRAKQHEKLSTKKLDQWEVKV